MKYYSLQNLKTWEDALEKGYLVGNKNYIMDDIFDKQYKWMMKQMSKRIGTSESEYPVWIWLSPSNISIDEIVYNKDNNYVILEIELPEDKVLLSNFDAWHIILNYGYFSDDIENVNQEDDWETLFDKEKLSLDGFSIGDEEDYQGVTGKIDISNIRVLRYILNK